MTNNEFMAFFRDNEKLNTLTEDEREELFRYALSGSSDFTAELLQEIFDDYDVEHLQVIEVEVE